MGDWDCRHALTLVSSKTDLKEILLAMRPRRMSCSHQRRQGHLDERNTCDREQ